MAPWILRKKMFQVAYHTKVTIRISLKVTNHQNVRKCGKEKLAMDQKIQNETTLQTKYKNRQQNKKRREQERLFK